MAQFIEATKDDDGNPKIYINVDTIAWVEPNGAGSRIVFNAVAAATEQIFDQPEIRLFEHDLMVKEAPDSLLSTVSSKV